MTGFGLCSAYDTEYKPKLISVNPTPVSGESNAMA
jgi:hypothetical protein